MNPAEQEELQAWREQVEQRAQGQRHAISRGRPARTPRTAAGAWRCEGRTQCAEQMDLWACLDEVVLDQQRAGWRDPETDESSDPQ